MKISIRHAIQVIGHEGSPKHLIGDQQFYAIGTPDDPSIPWFACATDESVQFRNIGNKVDAVIVSPSSLIEFEELSDFLKNERFELIELKKTKSGWFRKKEEHVFCNGPFVITIPFGKNIAMDGFRDSITIENSTNQSSHTTSAIAPR